MTDHTYLKFIESKILQVPKQSMQVPDHAIHPCLKPHQRHIVKWCLEGGSRAIFAAFGLGKTLMQLELMRITCKSHKCNGLIICPLGVKGEFVNDGRLNGARVKYITSHDQIEDGHEFYITNYERVRDGNIDVNRFGFVSLDEASVLRSYGSKTYQTFLQLFEQVPVKYVATATPSPNRYKEIIHYAGFLGIMDTGEALTRFFQRDSTKANNLTLYPHKEKEFWLWVSSWAVFLNSPADLGYDDTGYDLPPLQVKYHRLTSDHESAGTDSWGQFKLLRDAAISLKDASREKRDSIMHRLEKACEIINESPDDHFLLWHDLEAERHAIGKAIPEAKTVYGSQDLDKRESLIQGFANGEYRILATKAKIAGSGCNFQRHCHKAIFMGVSYKFNDFIQAIHRIYRFLQDQPVEIHIIYMDSEEQVIKVLQEKWQRHDELQEQMREIIKEYGLSAENRLHELRRTIGTDRREEKGERFTVVNNDCVDETTRMEENSVDLIHTSVPFSNHYEYSPSYNDFGHNKNDDRFFDQMDYLTQQLYRILKPGRVAAIHTKNRVRFGNVTGVGFPTINPFSHRCVFHYMQHGFQFIGEIIVLTDVVSENNQTYRLGWSENAKDSTKMGVGCPEYILLFRKPQSDLSRGYADDPVTKDKEEYTRAQWQIDAHAFWRSRGDRFFTPDELAGMDMEAIKKMYRQYSNSHIYDYDEHVRLGKRLESIGRLPASFMLFAPESWSEWIWGDVTRMHTLNAEQSRKNLQQHICPLQFDIVDRIIDRYSNPGELVFDPFGGLMTVPYRAIKKGRRGYGVELNTEYYLNGLGYCKAAEYEYTLPTLFSQLEEQPQPQTASA